MAVQNEVQANSYRQASGASSCAAPRSNRRARALCAASCVIAWRSSASFSWLSLTLIIFPLAPIVAPIPIEKIDLRNVRQPPSADHLLGTDMIGRDIWSRLVYGGRVSLAVGLVAVLIFMTIGTTLGGLAGYYGGTVDSVIMRITDTVMAFPVLVILISIVAIIGPGIQNVMLAIGLISWTGVARLVRSQVLSLRTVDFVLAAKASGVPEGRFCAATSSPASLAQSPLRGALVLLAPF